MAIGDLQLPLYPWGSLAPMLPQLAKAQSNVTASNIPGAKIPGPYDFLNAMSSLSNVQGENALRQQQMGLTNQQAELIKQRLSITPQFMGNINTLIQRLQGGGAPQQLGAQPMSAPAVDTVTGRDLGEGLQAGGALSPSQIAAHAEKAGFSPDKIPLITAIAMAESGGRPDAFNPKDPNGGSYGITQINGVHEGAKSALNDPQAAMNLAFKVSEGGTNFKPWSNYANGAYKRFLGSAPDTVENAPAEGSTPAAQGYTGKVPTYEPPPPTTASVRNLQSTPLAVHDAFAKYRQEGGQLPIEQFIAAGAGGAPASQPVRLAQNGPMPSMPSIRVPQLTPAQGAPMAPQTQMPGSLAPQGQGGIDPMALAIGALGAQGELIGFPNVATPLGQAYYNSPGYLQQKAATEADVKLRYAGPTKAAEALASNPLLIAQAVAQMYPAGSPQRAMADAYIAKEAGVPPIGGTHGQPLLQFSTKAGRYESPIVPGYEQGIEALAGAGERGREQAKQDVIYGDLLKPPANPAFPMGNAMPGAAPPPGTPAKAEPSNLPTGYQQFEDKSIWTPRGTILPSPDKQTLPKTPGEAKSYVDDIWPKTVDSWSAAAPLAEAAEQRTAAMVDAMQDLETKPFNNARADIAAKVRSLFGDGVADSIMSAKDVSAVQFIMHNSVANSLNTLKAVNTRFSQMEFKVNTQNSVNPDITIAANRQMAVNDLAMVRNIKTLPQDWLDAKRFQGWRNPIDFQAARMEGNPLKQQVASINRDMPPLKGETGNQGAQGPQIIQYGGKSYLKHDGKFYPIQP